MCGIIGISSNKSVSANIINSLKKLEYRGYDSAGVATLFDGEINEVKSEGRVDNLEQNFDLKSLKGNIGIGHVRWATHGVPNSINAHPHSSDNVSVVHNGIIENSTILKKYLINIINKYSAKLEMQCWGNTLAQALNLHIMLASCKSTYFETPVPIDMYHFGIKNDNLIENGEYEKIIFWLKNNIHKHGRSVNSMELVRNITGEELSSEYFINHLKTKLD